MSSVAPDTSHRSELRLPHYTKAARRGSFLAKFADGSSLEVEPSRARSYPGLRGEAPAMLPFYDAFADLLSAGGANQRVLDAGCGAGVGSARLIQRGFAVVAVDSDPVAVSFAQQQAPRAETLVLDLAQLTLAVPVHAAILSDVLGHTLEPEAILLSVARALCPGGQLLVAEAAAHVSQRLSAPQRRGFSVAQLKSLLLRTGFSVESVVLGRVPFVALLAIADAPEVGEAFARVYAQASKGELNDALATLDQLLTHGKAGVELEALLAQAEIQLARGDGDAAAAAYFRAREVEPNDSRPFVGLGRIALASNDANDALSLALNALALDATDPAAYALAGVAADALNHPDAFTAWRAAANLAPDDPMIADELTRGASARGDHRLALANLERLERYGVLLTAEHHLTRGWLLLKAGRRTEASLEARLARSKNGEPTAIQELEIALRG